VIAVEDLRSLLRYEPETGKLLWHRRGRVSFDRRWAGLQAFTAKDTHGYLCGAICGERVLAHRVVWALTYGEWPQGEIDHINGDRTDNRIENLRLVSGAENQRNKKRYTRNKSGVAGVSWHASTGKWQAQINVAGRQVHLGIFDRIEDAAAARKAAEQQHDYHQNHGRAA
jgi:HNH endonuclease/AP2 domain